MDFPGVGPYDQNYEYKKRLAYNFTSQTVTKKRTILLKKDLLEYLLKTNDRKRMGNVSKGNIANAGQH